MQSSIDNHPVNHRITYQINPLDKRRGFIAVESLVNSHVFITRSYEYYYAYTMHMLIARIEFIVLWIFDGKLTMLRRFRHHATSEASREIHSPISNLY